MTNNRQTLRASTQQAHSQSETRWTSILAKPQGVQQFLGAMQSLHQTHGLPAARLTGYADAQATELARIAALQIDLSTRQPPAPESPMNRDAAWGVLYALNGSALGATTLLSPGSALAGPPPRYLENMRDYARSGALGHFIRALNAQRLNIAKATAGAEAVFAALSHYDWDRKDTICHTS